MCTQTQTQAYCSRRRATEAPLILGFFFRNWGPNISLRQQIRASLPSLQDWGTTFPVLAVTYLWLPDLWFYSIPLPGIPLFATQWLIKVQNSNPIQGFLCQNLWHSGGNMYKIQFLLRVNTVTCSTIKLLHYFYSEVLQTLYWKSPTGNFESITVVQILLDDQEPVSTFFCMTSLQIPAKTLWLKLRFSMSTSLL